MNFAELEDNILVQLEPLGTFGVHVDHMPESTTDFRRDFEDARVFVAFNGLKSDRTITTSIIVQEDTITVAMVIQARLLRGATGAYQIYQTIRRILTGYTPIGCSEPMTSKSFDLISDEDDLFTFFAEFETKAKIVQVKDDDVQFSEGRITQINLNEPI